ncbi:fam-a protein [Plasmodium vinckei]|uniref:Fam-a protein n=1 Tax=Plasmodium vinckei TaxID=5860 RepID=A0A6V7SDE3_PLAVN|nr:fam-a protein [Plasmodium vinckei]
MNKFYILIVFFLLSIFIYVNNKTLATEPAPGKNTKTKEKEKTKRKRKRKEKEEEKEDTKKKSKKLYSTPEEIYEENKDLLCTNPNEITNAVKLMNEAATHLEHHATTEDGYEIIKCVRYHNNILSRKKNEDTVVQRIRFKYYHPNEYNEIINVLWDPALANKLNNSIVNRKIVRVYNPNLVIIRQRYKSGFFGSEKYFYALAAKIDISEEKAIIVMTSPNINDHHPSEKEYKNTIVESANLFKIDIDSEDDIRNGKIKKTLLNIGGYLIEKTHAYINITYLESIDGHTSNYNKLFIENVLIKFFHSNEKYHII